jgi:hypothetical protein
MKRRQFTQSLALMAGGLAASAYAGIPASHRWLQWAAPGADFSRDRFVTQIGGTFRLHHGRHGLVLKGIEDAVFDCPCEQFSLVFELGPGGRLEEGIHTLDCPDGSRLDLFLIPSGRSGSKQRLVSLFNLLPKA